MNSQITHNSAQEEHAKTRGGPAFHSRLEPHVEFIRQQRRQRKTWKEIAERLCAEKNCPITLQGVHQFYRRYVRRLARFHWEQDAAAGESSVAPTAEAESHRKPVLAVTPPARPFRQPNPNTINLNDPSRL
jgi:hypothetical protein